MNLELSTKMQEPGFLIDWASRVTYNLSMSDEQKDTSEALDAWARKIGERGVDRDNELAELVYRTVTNDVVAAPDEVLAMMFDEGSIGEFDDYRALNEPKNTIKVFEAVQGGNVDASYIDFTYSEPTWTELQAETYIKYAHLRRGGYKTVASLLNYINQAMRQKRWSVVFNAASAVITSGNANYISETGSTPSATSADALATYLMDVASAGETPLIVGMNKYILAMSKLAGAAGLTSNLAKEDWRHFGSIGYYAGCEMRGFSGVLTMSDGSFVIPNKTILGIGGKIGTCITRGETRVYETMNNNSEEVHLKVNGFSFGTAISKPENIAKVVMAS